MIDALNRVSTTTIKWHLVATYGRNDDVTDAASDVDLLLVTVPDDSIAAVATAVRPARAVVIHMAGSRTLEVLRPHDQTASLHPLASLPDPATAADRLTSGIAFAVAGSPIARQLVTALGGEAFDVPDHLRTRYHATAAVAANHLTVLCGQVERLAASVGVPADRYWELMASTLDTVRASSARAALTGPAARGDNATVEAHLADLPLEERPLYRVLATEATRLASTADEPDERRLPGRQASTGSEPPLPH